MSQSKRIAINTLSNWLGLFTSMAVLLFLAKFLLGRMQTDEFGMLRYAITIQGSLLILDLGLGATLNRFVSQLLAKREIQCLNATVSLVFLFFLGLGIIAGLVMFGFGCFLPSLIVGSGPELYRSGLRLMICMGGVLMIHFVGCAARGVLYGAQRYDIVSFIQAGAAILRGSGIAILFLVMDSAGLVVVGLCFLGSMAVETFLLWIFAKLKVPQLKLAFSAITKEVVKNVLGFSVYVMVLATTTMLMANIPVFLTGRLYGAESVALLSLPMLLLNQIQNIAGGFAFTLIPVGGQHVALGSQDALKGVMVKGTKICALICFPIGVIAVAFGKPLFEWFKDGFGWTWILLAIMMAPTLFRTTQKVSASILLGAGSIKWLAIFQAVTVLAIAVLSWWFAECWGLGLYGIALGTAIPMLLFSVFLQAPYACRQMGLSWFPYMCRSYGRVSLGILPTGIVAGLLVKFVYPGGLMMIIAESVICVLVYMLSIWLYVLADGERKQILGVLKTRFAK